MAQRKKSEIEFIQDTFSPQVAVLCSYDAEVICRKNSLTFVELVQPFCRYNGEIKISDTSNNLITIPNMRIEIKDINQIPATPLILKKILDEAVLNGLQSPHNIIEKKISTNNYDFTANLNTPWFESWREYFIKIGQPGEHEFLKHFIACIFVVSTSHLDPLDQFQKLILQLQQFQQGAQSSPAPKWFFPHLNNIYKYFVLLHDVHEGELTKANNIYENLKNIYGSSNCHLLQINSKSSQTLNALAGTDVTSLPGQQTVDFDPWLQYSKFNDLYNNTTNLNQPNATLSNGDEMRLKTTDSSSQIAHPLNENNNELDDNNELDSKKSLTADSSANGASTFTKRHGVCLAMSDHDRIKTFISDFVQRGLVPYAERTIKILNEQIQSKKSILKSFNIPRRIFGSSSGSSSSSSSSKSSAAAAIVAVSTAGLSSSTNANSLNSNSGINGVSPLTITNNFIHTNDDFTLRRLADLAFMFRLYDLAYSSYHTCKKDFQSMVNSNGNSENLLNLKMFLAGAHEMASIANFMQNFGSELNALPSSTSLNSLSSLNVTSSLSSSSKSYNVQYIEEAIQIYLHDCKNIYFSTRCVLLSTEALKASNLHAKAASQFITLANDETDIRSALFLEQAALCHLAQPMPWIRKYAFFMSLAGLRYNKSGQKKHSLRAYRHALEIYNHKNWFKAQDQINFIMGRLNYGLRNVVEALEHVESVIVKKISAHNRPITSIVTSTSTSHHHKAHNQSNLIEFSNETNILKDFILFHNSLGKITNTKKSLPVLSLPIIEPTSVTTNLNPIDSSQTLQYGCILANNENSVELMQQESGAAAGGDQSKSKYSHELKEMWQKFEETLHVKAFGSLPMLFKPQIIVFNKHTDNKHMPKVVVDEWLSVTFEIKNPLRIAVSMYDITLLWKFIEQGHTESNEPLEVSNEQLDDATNNIDGLVECSKIAELTLKSFESYRLRLRLKAKKPHGHLHILGIKYRFSLDNVKPAQLQQIELNDTIVCKQMFDLKGPRLNNNPQNMRSIVYDVDNRLNLKIINKTPLMQVEMDHLPTKLLCNQLERVRIYLVNTSSEMPIGNIKIASNGLVSSRISFNQPTLAGHSHERMQFLNKHEFKHKEDVEADEAAKQDVHTHKFNKQPNEANNSMLHSLDDVIIGPNSHYVLDMWLRAPDVEGEHKFYFMYFYQDFSLSPEAEAAADPTLKLRRKLSTSQNLKYRVIRYEFSVKTHPSLSIVNSNMSNSATDSNLLLNIEISNRNNYSTIELMELISVSDVWKVSPFKSVNGHCLKPLNEVTNTTLVRNKSTTSLDSLQLQFQQQLLIKQKGNYKKSDEQLSIVLKGEPVLSGSKQQQQQICIYQSTFESIESTRSANEANEKLNENVIFDFIRNDLKKQLLVTSNKTSYLNLNFICKCKMLNDENEEVTNYCLVPVKIIESLTQVNLVSFTYQFHSTEHRQALNKQSVPIVDTHKKAKNMIAISLDHEPVYKSTFATSNLFSVDICIRLVNLSKCDDFELALLTKNPRSFEIEKNYLWLGSNKKYVKLNSSQSKEVKFKLGFLRVGVFEIGKPAPAADLKLHPSGSINSNLNLNVNNNNNTNDTMSIASYDEFLDTESTSSMNVQKLNPVTTNDSGAVFVYLKNKQTNRYEFFKRLNQFSIIIS